jgi:hypothetical protein
MAKNVTTAIETLLSALPSQPRWTLLHTIDGKLIQKRGEFLHPSLSTQIVSRATQEHRHAEINLLDEVGFGTFQFSLHVGSQGVYIVFHLNDAYLLSLSYENVLLISFDAVIESVQNNFLPLLEALYENQL